MNKCVRVTYKIKLSEPLLEGMLKYGRSLGLEGTLQRIAEETLKIVICGSKEKIDLFVDALYQEGALRKPFSIEVEPFLKEKDYRGVFRILA